MATYVQQVGGYSHSSRRLSCCHTEMDGSWIALYPRPPAKYTVLSLVFFHDNRRPVDFCGVIRIFMVSWTSFAVAMSVCLASCLCLCSVAISLTLPSRSIDQFFAEFYYVAVRG